MLVIHPSDRRLTSRILVAHLGPWNPQKTLSENGQPNPNSSLKRQRSMCRTIHDTNLGHTLTSTHTHLHAYTQASVNKHICNMHTHKNPGNICKIQNKDGKLLRKSSDVDLWPLHIQARPHTYVGTQLFKHIHIPHTIKK